MAQSWGEDIVLALLPKFSALPLVNPPPTKRLSGQKHTNCPDSQPEPAPLPQSLHPRTRGESWKLNPA